ncbi:MAG: type II toxin-antitoxin system HicA family toxin [Proteobacteria bacterium]|nr:type II toxin-antitoxin system HicA family toxin [Pseudomonadota bacterium]
MPISGRDLAKELIKEGWRVKSQKGSHLKLEKEGVMVVIPMHRELKKGTEHAIRKQVRREQR